MAYTYTQLSLAYAAAHGGIEPTGQTIADLQRLTTAPEGEALSYILASADKTTAVAVMTYQFFTGQSPSAEGMAYLLNSTTNGADLNDAYYAKFNLENRFMNFAANLAMGSSARPRFVDTYGAMSFGDYVASIYETIIGKSYAQAAGLDVDKIVADVVARRDLILQSARDNGMIGADATPAQIDLALKTATAAYLLGEGAKADVGIYAGATNNFVLALVKGEPFYNVDITQTYAPKPGSGSSGTGKAIDIAPPPAVLPGAPTPPVTQPELPAPPPPPSGRSFTLTPGADTFTGGTGDDTFTGTHLTFFNGNGDILDGGAGHDTLTVTATGFLDSVYILPNDGATSLETIKITSDGGVNAGTFDYAGLTELNIKAGRGATNVTGTNTVDIDLTVTGQAGEIARVYSGHDVKVTSTGATTGVIQVGHTTPGVQPTGDVVVTRETAGAVTAGAITVNGGKTVSITQTATNALNTTQANGAVTVTGSTLTTEVTVKAPKAASTNSSSAGVTAALVTITDVNKGHATLAGTISKVALDGYAGLTFGGTALTDLSLSRGSGGIKIDNTGGAATATTLNLAINGLTNTSLRDEANAYTTLNITIGAEGSGMNSILASGVETLTLNGLGYLNLSSSSGLSGLKTLTIGGGASLITSLVNSTVTAVDASASTAGSTLSLNPSKTSFKGGSGNDEIRITTTTATVSKAIDLGGGDDQLRITTTAGSVDITGAIDGGAGADTLVIAATTRGVFTAPNNGISNIETLTISNDSGIVANVAALTDVTQLNATTITSLQLGAGAGTGVTATVTSQQADNLTIDGGKDVTLTASRATTGAIAIGASSLVSGAVKVSRGADGAVSAGAITVKGGTTVEIQQTATTAVNTTQTNGAVTVVGGAATTQITVKATKAAIADSATAGVTANTVAITDAASATTVGTITKATIDGYSTAAIKANALSTLNLAHGSGDITLDNASTLATGDKTTTLNLALNGVTGGTLDDADVYTTLNITTGAEASTLANITAAAVTTLNIAGDGGLALTSAAGMSKLQTVKISGAAGVTASLTNGTLTAIDASGSTGTNTVTINPARANYTGGSGVDVLTFNSVTISRSFALGDGDDMMIFSSGTSNFSNNSTLSGGGGIDTLKMTLTDARANGTPTFATNVTGFERLLLTSATGAHPINLANLGVHWVIVAGGNGMIMNNMNSGGTLELTGAGTAYTIANSAFTAGTDDTINLKLTSGSGAAVAFAATGITAAGVETINLTNTDTQTTPSGTFQNTVTLLGDDLKTLTITGNAGLTLTATSTALTTVDASGITKGGFTWTSGTNADATVVKGSATGVNTIDLTTPVYRVNYTGGSGADVITAKGSSAHLLNLGDGDNIVTATNGVNGRLEITAGSGNDTVTISGGYHTIKLGDGTNTLTVTSAGSGRYEGGAGADTISLAGGVSYVVLGSGADKVIITGSAGGGLGSTAPSIQDFGSDDQLDIRPISGVAAATSLGAQLTGKASLFEYIGLAMAGDGSATSIMSWFQLDGDTYVAQDNRAASTFAVGTDRLVKLVGLVDLTGWSITNGVLSNVGPV